jgi:peptidoglycan/LPS O-acetylase OafA/YrhL
MEKIQNYRKDIDGVRAIAIVSVVLFHYFPRVFGSGFIGVDIFFVISGYLITTSIINQLQSKSFGIKEFYLNRVLRLGPSLLMMYLVITAVAYVLLYKVEFNEYIQELFYSNIFATNVFYFFKTGYFDINSSNKVLLHMWSLSVEEQFYLIWPMLIAFAIKRDLKVLNLSVLIFLLSLSSSVLLMHVDASANFYLPIPRFYEFVIGAILCQLNEKTYHKYVNELKSLVGILLIFASFIIIDEGPNFPGWIAIFPTLGAALLIASKGSKINELLLSNRILTHVGQISYPLYLFHWPLLSLACIYNSGMPEFKTKLLVLFFSYLISLLVYKFVEIEFRFNMNRYKSLNILKNSMLLLLLLSLVNVVNNSMNYDDSDDLESKDIISQFNQMPSETIISQRCLARYRFDHNKHWFCAMNHDKNPDLVLLGNSFANHHYFGFINNTVLSSKTILSIGVCDPARPLKPAFDKNNNVIGCDYNYAVKEQSYIDNLIVDQGVKFAVLDGIDREAFNNVDYALRLIDRINFLEKNKVTVVVFMPHYLEYIDIKKCVYRPFREAGDCAIRQSDIADFHMKFSPLEMYIKNNSNAKIYYQDSILCSGSECNFIVDKNPIFRDLQIGGRGGHYSAFGSVESAKDFVKWASIEVPELVHE